MAESQIFTIRQVLQLTAQSQFKNRIDYKERDVLKGIQVTKVKKFDPFNLDKSPVVKYRIKTRSYPMYKPYTYIKGKLSKKQRKIFHDYTVILEIDRLSIDTLDWKMRVGSEKNIKPAPQSQIKSISQDTLKNWKRQADRKFKTKKEQSAFVKKKREDQKKSGKYLTEGDYQSRVLGINQDFLYRCEYVYKIMGHLYGRDRTKGVPPSKTNKLRLMFFPKHALRVIEVLMKSGVLKKDF